MADLVPDRLDFARRNAAPLAADPRVRAVIVTGSVARGTADEASDVDTLVFWDEPLSAAEFEAACEAARASGGGVFGGTPEQGFGVYHYIDGIRCDFGHALTARYEETLARVLEDPEPDLERQLIASGFLHGVPIHGEAWHATWRDRLAAYPPALGSAMVRKHLRFYPLWALDKMGVERGDHLFVRESLLEGAGNILAILCGLNGVYHPGKLKGMAWTVARLAVKPDRVLERLESLFEMTGGRAVETFGALVHETLDLVDAHMPEVGTARTRTVLASVLRR